MDDTQEPGTQPATQTEDHEAVARAAEPAQRPVPDQTVAAPDPDNASTVPSRSPSADAADQSELDLGVISTGSPAVDHALEPLESVTDLPVGDHPPVFDRVLADLSATLSASDASSHLDGDRDADTETSSGDPEATVSDR